MKTDIVGKYEGGALDIEIYIKGDSLYFRRLWVDAKLIDSDKEDCFNLESNWTSKLVIRRDRAGIVIGLEDLNQNYFYKKI